MKAVSRDFIRMLCLHKFIIKLLTTAPSIILMRCFLYFCLIIIQSLIRINHYNMLCGNADSIFCSPYVVIRIYDARKLLVNLFLGVLRSQNDLLTNKTSLKSFLAFHIK